MPQKPETNLTLVRLAKQAGVSVEVAEQVVREMMIKSLMEDELKAPRTSKAHKQLLRAQLGLPQRGPKSKPDRIVAIVNSIEAFRATGLRRKQAEEKAAEAWCLSRFRVQNIYKLFKAPSGPGRWDAAFTFVGRKPPRDRDTRDIYRQLKLTEQQVSEAIKRHRRGA